MAGWTWEAAADLDFATQAYLCPVHASEGRFNLSWAYPKQPQHVSYAALAANLLPVLLAAVEERDGIIADMMLDASPAVEAERGRIGKEITAIREKIKKNRRHKRDIESTQAEIVCDLFEVCIGPVRELLPPDRVRTDNDRLRAALRQALADLTPPNGQGISAAVTSLLAALEEKT